MTYIHSSEDSALCVAGTHMGGCYCVEGVEHLNMQIAAQDDLHHVTGTAPLAAQQ